MENKQTESGLKTFLSTIYILVALCLLVVVCIYCYPTVGQEVREIIGGWEDSPVREAFGTLADGLEAGLPVKETVAASFEVLIGDAG